MQQHLMIMSLHGVRQTLSFIYAVMKSANSVTTTEKLLERYVSYALKNKNSWRLNLLLLLDAFNLLQLLFVALKFLLFFGWV